MSLTVFLVKVKIDAISVMSLSYYVGRPYILPLSFLIFLSDL